jgi:hypothetical protein
MCRWELPRGWIEEVPKKGFLELVYFTSAKQVRIDCRRALIPRCLVSEETDLSELADPFALLKVKDKLAGIGATKPDGDGGAGPHTPAGKRPPSASAKKGLAAMASRAKEKRSSGEDKAAEDN